ncbi:MAG TPA: bifunctional phosphoribosylaminoimidazolecarboxamide formyltransferase/IMP cyclohydrolase [Candidatus Omnitrophica bacterium]|nr:bifunctional phosphoribosylaminoimidazolecarboxamide formyltransferase/IMP cyclohydrolase [Candidatus Omnitrophota bacterium]
MLKIRRALISVWDKKGIVEFVRNLVSFKVGIISTGKTASLLRKKGIDAKDVSSITSYPAILSERVKTLHPKIFGAILANKKHPLHMEEIKSLKIDPIDMVVCNLYPFKEKLKENLILDDLLEYIDIGGVSLLRAAAKNFKNVACVSNPSQYRMVLEELEKNNGFLKEDTLKKLAADAFYITKEYDNCIYHYFKGKEILSLNLELVKPLHYGENPHQDAYLYKKINGRQLNFNQIQGKELSYNNFLDAEVALECVKEFEGPAVSIVKHGSLCGIGIDKKLVSAYKKAYKVDSVSSFGAILGLNKKVDKETAYQIVKTGFKECIVAPSYSKEALRIFSSKKRLRVLEVDFQKDIEDFQIRNTLFGYLMQDKDRITLDESKVKVVTKAKPTQRQLKDLFFAWKVVKFVKSNAIVIVKNLAVLGIGGGQPSRVGALKEAISKSIKSCKGAVVASDGFFPKEDSIAIASKYGIKAIIQPGGSIKDKDIIDLCNRKKIAMVFTGIRHFRH